MKLGTRKQFLDAKSQIKDVHRLPDLLMIDLGVVGKDTTSNLLHNIRGQLGVECMPIVLMCKPGERLHPNTRLVNAVLTKPVKPGRLLAALEKACKPVAVDQTSSSAAPGTYQRIRLASQGLQSRGDFPTLGALPQSGAQLLARHVLRRSASHDAILRPVPVVVANQQQEIILSPPSAGKSSKQVSYPSGMAQKFPLEILIAEDNLVGAKLLLKMLEKMGYTAQLASDGLIAVKMVQQREAAVLLKQASKTETKPQETKEEAVESPFDLVLMDLQMPNMGGIEAARHIRSKVRKDFQPFIAAVTANFTPEDRASTFDAGMQKCLHKPVLTVDLVAVLSQCPQLAFNKSRPGSVH
jgi:CheY-like chemotaxis protein